MFLVQKYVYNKFKTYGKQEIFHEFIMFNAYYDFNNLLL